MGDHRFYFRAEFGMHGIEDKINLDWCNWSGGHNEIDRRIVDWIEGVRDRAMAKFDHEEAVALAERRKDETERAERAELARLKEKYGDR